MKTEHELMCYTCAFRMNRGGVQQQQQQQKGNANRAMMAGKYLVPISSLVQNYFNHWLSHKFWCLMMRGEKEEKRREKERGEREENGNGNGNLDLIMGP